VYSTSAVNGLRGCNQIYNTEKQSILQTDKVTYSGTLKKALLANVVITRVNFIKPIVRLCVQLRGKGKETGGRA